MLFILLMYCPVRLIYLDTRQFLPIYWKKKQQFNNNEKTNVYILMYSRFFSQRFISFANFVRFFTNSLSKPFVVLSASDFSWYTSMDFFNSISLVLQTSRLSRYCWRLSAIWPSTFNFGLKLFNFALCSKK